MLLTDTGEKKRVHFWTLRLWTTFESSSVSVKTLLRAKSSVKFLSFDKKFLPLIMSIFAYFELSSISTENSVLVH